MMWWTMLSHHEDKHLLWMCKTQIHHEILNWICFIFYLFDLIFCLHLPKNKYYVFTYTIHFHAHSKCVGLSIPIESWKKYDLDQWRLSVSGAIAACKLFFISGTVRVFLCLIEFCPLKISYFVYGTIFIWIKFHRHRHSLLSSTFRIEFYTECVRVDHTRY